jgi:hypothetical protein
MRRALFAKREILRRVAPLGVTFGFAPVLCNPHPEPCLGLGIGDELVITIDETQEYSDLLCDFEALGFTVGNALRLKAGFKNGEA